MTEVLNLTTFERENLRQWMGSPNHRVVGLTAQHIGLAVLTKLELTDEEKESVGWKDLSDTQATWEAADDTFEIEFTKAELRALKPALQVAWPISVFYEQMLEKLEEVI